MERIHARALETENRVRMLETDGMRLQLYQSMLTNISTQARAAPRTFFLRHAHR